MADFVSALINSFIVLFVILDPFLGLAVFIPLTRNSSAKQRSQQALVAVSVAFILLFFFLITGTFLLDILGITFPSFRVAGGIILLLLGIQQLLGLEFGRKENKRRVGAVIIGTPLLCGPGAITTIIILQQKYGFFPPFIALLLCAAITWVMLIFAEKISKLIGDRLLEVLSRVLGLMLAAMAAEFIKDGVIGMIEDFRKGL